MDESKFREFLLRAEAFRKNSDNDNADFWYGYVLGLRRLYHGEKFGTDEVHNILKNMSENELDLGRRARGQGYRKGLAGINPVEVEID